MRLFMRVGNEIAAPGVAVGTRERFGRIRRA
jgi:hypothetical protein